MKKPWVVGLASIVVAAAGGLGLARWGPRPAVAAPGARGAKDRSIPVQTVLAREADVPIVAAGLGTVVSRHSVTVRSRVSGQLLRVLFREGELVRQGQLLAEIDPRPFQVQLTQIEGQATRDQALLDNAVLDQHRFKVLKASDLISGQQADTQDSLVRQYQGGVRTDEGLLGSARLQLEFTRITAPTTGRIGLRLVDAGNNVTPTDASGIAVINELQPITVVFSLPEDRVPGVVQALRATGQSGRPLVAQAWDRAETSLLATGTLLTIDNQIDPTTGTVKLKAEFLNVDETLFPNQFVNVRLVLDVRRGATVIPSIAVQRGGAGPWVYVATADNKAAVRTVELGPSNGPDVAVDRGVAPGELVVTNGTDQLREGAELAIAAPTPDRQAWGQTGAAPRP